MLPAASEGRQEQAVFVRDVLRAGLPSMLLSQANRGAQGSREALREKSKQEAVSAATNHEGNNDAGIYEESDSASSPLASTCGSSRTAS